MNIQYKVHGALSQRITVYELSWMTISHSWGEKTLIRKGIYCCYVQNAENNQFHDTWKLPMPGCKKCKNFKDFKKRLMGLVWNGSAITVSFQIIRMLATWVPWFQLSTNVSSVHNIKMDNTDHNQSGRPFSINVWYQISTCLPGWLKFVTVKSMGQQVV